MDLGKETIRLPERASPHNIVLLLFEQLRPRQWTKNLLVFAVLAFSREDVGWGELLAIASAFLLFCFVSGCVYILNDYVDREADRRHPDKAGRPMASGRLRPAAALTFGGVLLACSLGAGIALSLPLGLLLAAYFALNVAYTLKLKHVVILDIMTIAAGFAIRAVGGGLVIGAEFTSWFLMCVFFLSLFLAVGKRRHELLLLEHNKGSHRKVLMNYSEPLLNQLSGVVTAMTIMSYSLYTFISNQSVYMMWTIPCVIYGMFRYLYLIHVLGKGGKPEALLYEDKGLMACVLVFGAAVVVIMELQAGSG